MENLPIVIEHQFNVPASKVWTAITDKGEMKKWYFSLEDFVAEPGFKFQFSGGPADGVQYLHLCEIIEAIPEKKLTYSWRYDGYAGMSYVSFELVEMDNKTVLKLTHSGLESFPEDQPDFAKHNFEAGWNQIIHVSLKDYLEPLDQ